MFCIKGRQGLSLVEILFAALLSFLLLSSVIDLQSSLRTVPYKSAQRLMGCRMATNFLKLVQKQPQIDPASFYRQHYKDAFRRLEIGVRLKVERDSHGQWLNLTQIYANDSERTFRILMQPNSEGGG